MATTTKLANPDVATGESKFAHEFKFKGTVGTNTYESVFNNNGLYTYEQRYTHWNVSTS